MTHVSLLLVLGWVLGWSFGCSSLVVENAKVAIVKSSLSIFREILFYSSW